MGPFVNGLTWLSGDDQGNRDGRHGGCCFREAGVLGSPVPTSKKWGLQAALTVMQGVLWEGALGGFIRTMQDTGGCSESQQWASSQLDKEGFYR